MKNTRVAHRSITIIPFHIHPTESQRPGGDGICFGDFVVIGNILWYIERDHTDTRFGILKQLNLRTGDVEAMGDLPLMGWLHSSGGDVLAVSTDQVFVFKNGDDSYSCHALGYEFDDVSMKITGFKANEGENMVLPRPSLPVRICASFSDDENIWIATRRFRSPADSSKRYTLIGGGLFRLDLKKRRWDWVLKANDIGDSDISFIGGGGGGLFLGTKDRLFIHNPQEESVKVLLTRDDGLLHTEVRLCSELGDEIWIASNHGYTIYNRKDGSMIKYREPMDMKFKRQKFDRGTKTWAEEEEIIAIELPYYDIYSIMDLEKSTLYGTSQGLFIYYKESDEWKHCGPKEGLSSQWVFSISIWEGQIILGTNNGLFHIPNGAT